MSATEKLYELPSPLGIGQVNLPSALTARNLVNHSIDVFSAQNDYPIQELNGLFLIPNILIKSMSLLVLLLSM